MVASGTVYQPFTGRNSKSNSAALWGSARSVAWSISRSFSVKIVALIRFPTRDPLDQSTAWNRFDPFDRAYSLKRFMVYQPTAANL